MARLPSISRDIQFMLRENMLAIKHKMGSRKYPESAEPYPEEILAQLEVMARINSVNLKADPQAKGKGSTDDDEKDTDPSAIVEAARRLESRTPPSVGATSEDEP